MVTVGVAHLLEAQVLLVKALPEAGLRVVAVVAVVAVAREPQRRQLGLYLFTALPAVLV